uniref:Uncharacterized protein n=1 Tax=Avena sativa TaxID=4498 RepID=A0ACD5UYL5_AVESA
MGESHHRPGHFIGTDLCPEPKPPLLSYIFSWKHLRDPADFGRLEEFNEAVRRLESGGHRMDSSAAEQVAPVVVIAAQSAEIAVGGGGGGPGKKPRFRSLNFICGKGRDAEDGPEQGRAPQDEKTDRRAEGDDDMAASACEGISNDDVRSPAISVPMDAVFGHGDQAVGEHHHQGSVPGSGEVCHDDHETTPSSSPESFVDLTSSTSTEAVEVSEHSPDCAQDAGSEGDQMASPVEAHLQVPAPTSCGDVVGDEVQYSGPGSTNLPSRAASPSAAADKTGGGGCVDPHGQGERIAMEMDKDAIRSENVGQVDSVVVTTAQAEIDADVGASGGQKKKAKFRRMTFVCGKGRKSRDVENGRERAPPEKTDGQCTDGDVGASASCAGMQSPFVSTPPDGFLGKGTKTDPANGGHHEGRSSPGCGNDDQESRPSSSRKSLVDLNLSPRTDADEALDHSPACAHDATTEGDLATPLAAYLQVPAPASGDVVGAEVQDFGPSSPNLSDDTVPSRAPSPSASADNTGGGGSIDLHRLGERIAMEMDEDAIRLEVARQFGAHRPRRGARRRAAAPVVPRVQFSLRLSHEEAMEDVAAVSIPEDVEPEAPAPAGHGSRKRRRRGG